MAASRGVHHFQRGAGGDGGCSADGAGTCKCGSVPCHRGHEQRGGVESPAEAYRRMTFHPHLQLLSSSLYDFNLA